MTENKDQESGNYCYVKATVDDIITIFVKSKLQPFWRDKPQLWFFQFEAIITSMHSHCNDDQKYSYLLQQLQSEDIGHISDLILNPPVNDKYETAKKRLLSVYDQSVNNFRKLISNLELGNQKPSMLLRTMRELNSMTTSEQLRIIWLNKLPAHIQDTLSVNSESSLDTLAAMADKMLEIDRQPVNSAILSTTSLSGSTEINACAKNSANLRAADVYNNKYY